MRPKAGAGSVARERLRRRAKGLGQELRSSVRFKRERRKPGFYVLGNGKFSGVMGPFICIF